MTTEIKKKKHHRYNTQERVVIAHTVGGSHFFKVGDEEKESVKAGCLVKPETPPKINAAYKLCCTIL